MKVATFIREIVGGSARQALYKVSPSVEYDFDYEKDKYTEKTDFIVISTAFVPFTGVETYIFPANKKGEIIDWGELSGSERGTQSHIRVLKNAGYTLKK